MYERIPGLDRWLTTPLDELDEDNDDIPTNGVGLACKFTCPIHGEVSGFDVAQAERNETCVYVHTDCGQVCLEEWF